ncbi:MAG: sensor histidine kinase [Bacteroidota bacterium]|nr:ATP-binding protein [Kiloniellaceae bacterium]
MPGTAVAVPLWLLLAGSGLWLLTVALIVHRLRRAPRDNDSRAAAAPAAGDADARAQALQIQLQEALRRLKAAALTAEEAERANKAKSAFLAMMSHELRTPLSAIIGFAEMIEQQAMGPIGNEKYSAYATDIRESGQHVLGIINDILDLSKVEAGKETLQEQAITVDALIAGVRVLVEGRARAAGVQLVLDCPAGLPGLRADKRRLTQILVNLLSNGVKFTPKGGTVTLRCRAAPGSGFVFQASDTGIGIAREDIPLALSVFGQIDNGTKEQAKGTGLGLPLAKALAELHGGTLDLESEPGQGTTVTLRLPAHRTLARPAETAEPMPRRAAG